MFHVSLLTPFIKNQRLPREPVRPPALHEFRDGSQHFEFESILDKKVGLPGYLDGRPRYTIKWKGYAMTKCTREPAANLRNVQNLIAGFEGPIT